LVTGVLGLKKACQLALIWAAVDELPPDEDEDEDADDGAAEVDAGALALAEALEPGDELPLLHAATATVTSRANAATENTLTGWNRI
jgi:hypothetical protein